METKEIVALAAGALFGAALIVTGEWLLKKAPREINVTAVTTEPTFPVED